MLQKKSFYFVRHGESEHNKLRICAGGKSDSPLTVKGIAQAHVLKEKVSLIGIDHVISSSMIRAKQTAEIIGGRPPLLVDENLREIDLGDFEGKQAYEEIGEYMINLPFETPVPGGESKLAFTARITHAFNRWLNAYEGNILFVAHGFVYATLLSLTGKAMRTSDFELRALIHFYHNGIHWEVSPTS